MKRTWRHGVHVIGIVAVLAAFPGAPALGQGGATLAEAVALCAYTNPPAVRQQGMAAMRRMADGEVAGANQVMACRTLSGVYQREGMTNDFIAVSAKLLAIEPDPGYAYMTASTLANAYSAQRDYGKAVGVLETYLQSKPALDAPDNMVAAAKALVPLYADGLGKPREAVLAVVDREIARLPSNAVSQAAGLMIFKAGILGQDGRDLAGAEALYGQVLDMSNRVLRTTWADAGTKLVQLHVDARHPEKAVPVLLRLMRDPGVGSASPLVQKLMDCKATPEQMQEAVRILRQRIWDSGAAGSVVEACQPDIVKLLLRMGRQQEALQESRVAYLASSDRGLPAAIDLVTLSFKAGDHNLARANRFLRFQKYGPAGQDGKAGLAGGLANVLLDAPALDDKEREAACLAKMADMPEDWTGYRRRGEACLYLDRPADAFDAFKKSFWLCPMTTADLQSAADELTGLIVRATREPALAGTMVEFLMFGEAGKDGMPGTADDVKDPTPEILRRMQYAAQPSAVASLPEKPMAPKPADEPTQAPAAPSTNAAVAAATN